MAPAGKLTSFYGEGNDWFCNATLPSDIVIEVEGVFFHLHKFPIMFRCGKMANILEEPQNKDSSTLNVTLSEFPGGPDTFLVVAKFCYGIRVELTSKNIVLVYCAADYLEMTEEYGEDNLLAKSESFFHKNILCNWKDCILALQSSDLVVPRAENLQIEKKCLNSISMMACTDPNLSGWPMNYGSLQSPGGSILWNGINTGARIRISEFDWWFEDVSCLSVHLFGRLIQTMNAKGMKPETLVAAVMYYARKYLPGLGRWQSGQSRKPRTVASFNSTPVSIDQRLLLESIEKMLPEKKGKSFCRFLLGLLRVAIILDVSQPCKDSLERRVGRQLDKATLDSLLIPSYSDADTLYNTDCVEQIIQHFLSGSNITSFSPSSFEQEMSPDSSEPLKKVAKLIDSYIAEVAADVNLTPKKLQSLLEALPECSRTSHDGLYRALDIYFKEHPWLSENGKAQLCNIIDYRKLSVAACAHASQNKRLPLRVILQVLFFEQLRLRTAIASFLHVSDNEGATAGAITTSSEMAGQIRQRDGWFTVVRENRVLRVDMERMRTRVGELERECVRIKQEMQKVAHSRSSLSSSHLLARRFGCKLLPRSQVVEVDIIENAGRSPRVPIDQSHPPRSSRNRRSFSLLGLQCKE